MPSSIVEKGKFTLFTTDPKFKIENVFFIRCAMYKVKVYLAYNSIFSKKGLFFCQIGPISLVKCNNIAII